MRIFSLLLAVILLVIFGYLLWDAYDVANDVIACATDTVCAAAKRLGFNPQKENAFNLISGLIAAVVVAELAITAPTQLPGLRVFAADPDAPPQTAATAASIAYIGAWMLAGIASFGWASLNHPDALQVLTNYGTTWLGLAVAAGYAYFGVKRG
jgi:hypothetical protein